MNIEPCAAFIRGRRCAGAGPGLAAVCAILLCLIAQTGWAGSDYRLLHGFPTNSYPQSTLVFGDDGAMYGTTQMGGDFGYGSIFRITTNGDFATLFSFNRTNGAYPFSGLLKAENGNFYGTAQNYGPLDYGTVFRFHTNGELTTLFSFADTNGAYPKGVLTWGTDGALYGTTFRGGREDYGTVFRLSTNGDFTSMASFAQTNGAYPFAGVVQGQDGAFYGVTRHGGIFDGFNGYGTIFRVTLGGSLTTLHAFDAVAHPVNELLQTEDGLLYGVTSGGFFRVTTNGTFSWIAHTPPYPLSPRSALVRGFDGAFYGMAYDTSYRLTTNGVAMPLYPFYNFWNGADPRAGLTQGAGPFFYGTTAQGGPSGGGVVFRIELTSLFYPLTRATNGWTVLFAALASSTNQVLRASGPNGPWEPAASVLTDEYGVGRWVDTSAVPKAFYRLAYP